MLRFLNIFVLFCSSGVSIIHIFWVPAFSATYTEFGKPYEKPPNSIWSNNFDVEFSENSAKINTFIVYFMFLIDIIIVSNLNIIT